MPLEIERPTPVFWNSQQHCWVITRYADVRRAFQQPEVFASDDRRGWEVRAQSLPGLKAVLALITDIPVRLDGTAHAQQHAIFGKVFAPRLLAQLRPKLERRAAALLHSLAGCEEFDLIADFADPFCLGALLELLGLPEDARASVTLWSAAHRWLVQALLSGVPTLGLASTEILSSEYETLCGWVAERRIQACGEAEEPPADLISALIGAEENGYRLSNHEIAVFLHFLLLVAGHETATQLISLSVWELLCRRDDWNYLAAHPERIPAAIPELARFTSPVMALPRFLRQDVILDGQCMKRGDAVLLSVASANRDPERFENPEILDVRGVAKHAAASLAFGHGAHFCVGMSMARLEAEVAIGSLMAHFPDLETNEESPELQPSAILRSLRRLRVRSQRMAGVSA